MTFDGKVSVCLLTSTFGLARQGVVRVEETFGHEDVAGLGVDQAVGFFFYADGLGVHVARDEAAAKLAFEGRYAVCPGVGVFRAAVVGEAKASPFADYEGDLASVEEGVAHDKGFGCDALVAALDEPVESG